MVPSAFHAKPVDSAYWTQLFELIFYGYIIALLWISKTKIQLNFLLLWLFLSVIVYYLQDSTIWGGQFRVLGMPKYNSVFIAGMMIRNIGKRQCLVHSYLVLLLCFFYFFLWNNWLSIMFFSISFIVIYASAFINIQIGIKKIVFNNWIVGGITFFASISYPLYLIHQKIGYVIIVEIIENVHLSSEYIIIVPIITSIFIAWLINKYIEKRLSNYLLKHLNVE